MTVLSRKSLLNFSLQNCAVIFTVRAFYLTESEQLSGSYLQYSPAGLYKQLAPGQFLLSFPKNKTASDTSKFWILDKLYASNTINGSWQYQTCPEITVSKNTEFETYRKFRLSHVPCIFSTT